MGSVSGESIDTTFITHTLISFRAAANLQSEVQHQHPSKQGPVLDLTKPLINK